MRRDLLTLIIGILFFTQEIARGQCTYFLLGNQAQVDTFANNNCSVVDGILQITGDQITNLDGLAGLTSVEELYITYMGNLTSLNGLNNLTHAGLVDIRENPALADISALSGLTSTDSSLIIRDCNALISFEGLHNISFVGGHLWVEHNQGLIDLQGLRSITEVDQTIWINDNDLLTDLNGLQNLTSANRLGIVEHENLVTLNGLQGLTHLPTGLIIRRNLKLEDLLGLEYVTHVGQELYIEANTVLKSLLGLSSLTSVGGDPDVIQFYRDGLSIISSKEITNLAGLESLKSISGSLWIQDMDGLQDLTGLNGLETVEGYLDIRFSDNLVSLNGLSKLQTIGRDLTITSNPKLAECSIQVICDYLSDPPGASNFFGNAIGCRNGPEILSRCSPFREFRLLDANPKLYEDFLGIIDSVAELTPQAVLDSDFLCVAIAADGVTEVVVIARFIEPGIVDFTFAGQVLRRPWGVNTVELNGSHYAFGILRAPEDFTGTEDDPKDPNGIAKMEAFLSVAHSGKQVTEKLVPVTIVRPPVILVHGTFDNADNCWKTPAVAGMPTMFERLSTNGYKVFTLDYSESSGNMIENSSFDDNSHVLWDSTGGIKEALTFYRDQMYACTQVDVVGHSLGGIIPRIYMSEYYNMEPGYKRPDNFMQGDINRLITIGSTHFGSDLGAFKVFLENQDLFSDPLAWLEGQAAAIAANYLSNAATSEAVIDQVPPSLDGQPTPISRIGESVVPSHAIASYVSRGKLKNSMYDPDQQYYTTYRYMSLLMYYAGALRESYLETKKVMCEAGLCPETTRNGDPVPHLDGLDEEEVIELIESGVNKVLYYGGQIIDIIDGTFEYPSKIDVFKYVMGEVGMSEFADPLLQYFLGGADPLVIFGQYLWKNYLKPEIETRVNAFLGEEEAAKYDEAMIETLRFLVFNHDENDGTVRVESQLGRLNWKCPDCVTVVEDAFHSFQPRYPQIQERVLNLLNGGMWHFSQEGFPAASDPLPFYYPEDRIDIFKSENSREEAICWSGMLPEHAEAYARVADRDTVIVIVRPVNPDGLDLLNNGAATKKMKVKPKSSNWGPQKGYLPVNQRYSKIPKIFADADGVNETNETFKKICDYTDKAESNIPGDARKRHLQLDICRESYWVYIDHAKNTGVRDCKAQDQSTFDPYPDDEVILVPVDNESLVCPWKHKPDALDEVFSSDVPVDRSKCVTRSSEHNLEPLEVLASKDYFEGTGPRFLTADYDLLMIGFYKGENNPYDPPMDIPLMDSVGQITPAQIDLVRKLNAEANHAGGDLTHHGPENQFSQSPFIDYPLTVFAPDDIEGESEGKIFTIRQGPLQFRDINLKRYVNEMRQKGFDLYDNVVAPGWKWKWNEQIVGFELADSPDLASYLEEFPLNKCNKDGEKERVCEGMSEGPHAQNPPKGPHGSETSPDGRMHWRLYPNPVFQGTDITIEVESTIGVQTSIIITNAIGTPVLVQELKVAHGVSNFNIDIGKLERGWYMLRGHGGEVIRFTVF